MIQLPNTMSFRLTLWYAFALISLFVVAFLVLYLSLGKLLDYRIDEDLKEDIFELKMMFDEGGHDKLQEEIDREQLGGEIDDFFIRVLDAEGNEIYASDLTHWKNLHTDKKIIKQLAQAENSFIVDTIELESQEEDARVIYGTIGSDVILHIGESTGEKMEVLELLSALSLVILFIVVPLASGVGWFIARQAMQGVNEVNGAVSDIEEGKLDSRVAVKTQQDEIQTLAISFNAMADRIRLLISEMREMIDNIAHDLRSPLGRIRAISESALSGTTTEREYKAAAADTLEECDRLIQLINTTLDVAEAESGVSYSAVEEINISKLIEDACELFDPVAEEKHIEFTCALEANCAVKGNKSYLQRMFANLIDNALKYTPSLGTININLKQNDNAVNITVSDTGIGIPDADQYRIFERFYRCDNSRTNAGCGLGLSFARAVARGHGGDITLTSAANKGSVFTVTLPSITSVSQ